jgi:hypothetical protein
MTHMKINDYAGQVYQRSGTALEETKTFLTNLAREKPPKRAIPLVRDIYRSRLAR